MFEKLKPLSDRLLVKLIEQEEKTDAGIIIPDAAKEKVRTGTVLAVGPGKRDESGALISLDVSVGDEVYFGKYAGTEITADYFVIREDEILGILLEKTD